MKKQKKIKNPCGWCDTREIWKYHMCKECYDKHPSHVRRAIKESYELEQELGQ